ncbi:MAG: signal peptidase I [Eubacteriales bacterium]|nr:signal peptidase I [Eubacteriales bacterium]
MKKKGALLKPSGYRIVLLMILSLVIGAGVYRWNARNLMGNELPMPFGYGSAVVLSGSMEPALSVNDWIMIKETETYETGDIVVFQSEGELIVHRVIGIGHEMIQTKGDANLAADEPVALSCVKGKVIGRVPKAGVMINAVKSPPGIAVILIAAVFLMELSYRKDRERDDGELEKLKDEIRKLKEERE